MRTLSLPGSHVASLRDLKPCTFNRSIPTRLLRVPTLGRQPRGVNTDARSPGASQLACVPFRTRGLE
jgi:hypothetical protein